MEKIHLETCIIFCGYMLKIYKKALKQTCFHVFTPFSAHLYPHYIIING